MPHIILLSVVGVGSWLVIDQDVPENLKGFVGALVALETGVSYLFLYLRSNQRFVSWHARSSWPSVAREPEKMTKILLLVGSYLLAASGIIGFALAKLLGIE